MIDCDRLSSNRRDRPRTGQGLAHCRAEHYVTKFKKILEKYVHYICVVETKGFLGITHLNYIYAIVLVVGNGQQGQCMLENDMKEQQHSLMSGLGAPNPRICSKSIQHGRNRRCKSNAQSCLGQV